MSCPLASILNPLKEAQVLVFYLSKQMSTALEVHDITAKDTNPILLVDNLEDPVPGPKISNPGAYSAIYNEGLVSYPTCVPGHEYTLPLINT